MSSKSDILKNQILNHILRGFAMESPASVWLALYVVAPTDAGGGVEVSGGGYVRKQITFGPPITNGLMGNDVAVNFPVATLAWGTVVAAGLFNASSGGQLLYHGLLASSFVVNAADRVSFAVNSVLVDEQ